MSEIGVRLATAEDVPFIFATWLKSYRNSSFAKNIPSKIYFAWHHTLIENLLAKSTIVIAYPTEQPSVIVGYLVSQPNLVHFCYVKYGFRGLGVATKLISSQKIDLNHCQFTHATQDLNWIILKYPGLSTGYNPYAI